MSTLLKLLYKHKRKNHFPGCLQGHHYLLPKPHKDPTQKELQTIFSYEHK